MKNDALFEKSVAEDTWVFASPGLPKALLMKSERQGIWFVDLDGHKSAEVCHSSVPETWAKQRALPVIQRLIEETLRELADSEGFVSQDYLAQERAGENERNFHHDPYNKGAH